MQATIVALYGEKSSDLTAFLMTCQNAVVKLLGSRFRKYDIDQVHATVVGLERDESQPDCFNNRNYLVYRKAQVNMDFRGLLAYLRSSPNIPFQVQLGGFYDHDYSFVSRGGRPYNRSFSVQDRNVVIVGWPVRGMFTENPHSMPWTPVQQANSYPNILDNLRKGVQRYGVLHSYHQRPDDFDNDLFFRIGMVDNPVSLEPDKRAYLHNIIRGMLSEFSPLVLNIDMSSLFVAFYDSVELPFTRTNAYVLTDERLDADFIQKRYNV
jgi:hypothetical protein